VSEEDSRGALPAFIFDEAKSRANKCKHGVDFVEAQELWLDERLLCIEARTEDERRVLAVGRIGGTVWAAVFTYRGEVIRLISVRRAREKEARAYEGK
jgi:uncharacterized DUF497 family protein